MSLNVNGFPDEGLLHDEQVFARLQPLVAPLVSYLGSRSLRVLNTGTELDGRQLAKFVYDLGVFQEKVLGFGAPRPANPEGATEAEKQPLRLPASVLLTHPSMSDFSPLTTDAPLYAVLQAAFAFLAERGEATWDFGDAGKRRLYVALVAHVRTALQKAQVLPAVRLAAAPDMAEAEATHLRTLATRMGCTYHTKH